MKKGYGARYKEVEEEASQHCFLPVQEFFREVQNTESYFEECRRTIEGDWYMDQQVGAECTRDEECFTDDCFAPVDRQGTVSLARASWKRGAIQSNVFFAL